MAIEYREVFYTIELYDGSRKVAFNYSDLWSAYDRVLAAIQEVVCRHIDEADDAAFVNADQAVILGSVFDDFAAVTDREGSLMDLLATSFRRFIDGNPENPKLVFRQTGHDDIVVTTKELSEGRLFYD